MTARGEELNNPDSSAVRRAQAGAGTITAGTQQPHTATNTHEVDR